MAREHPSNNAWEWIRIHFPEFNLQTSTSAALADLARRMPQLLPKKVRKDTAAFYTSPWAADLLSRLAITGLETKICDPACGTGNLLLSALKVFSQKREGKNQILVIGSDINPVAAEVTKIVLDTFLQESSESRPKVEVVIVGGDAFHVAPDGAMGSCDLVIMNPPFSSQLRLARVQKDALKAWVETQGLGEFIDARMGLQFYFLFLADWYLKARGTLALVLPATTFAGKAASKLLQFLKQQGYSFDYLVETASQKGAFSIDCCWKEYLLVAKKTGMRDGSLPQTRLIRFDEEPSLIDVDKIAQMIISGQEQLVLGDKIYGDSKLIPAEKIFAGGLMSESNPYLQDIHLHDLFPSQNLLIPLGKSEEIGCFRGFDATYSRFLILPNDFLAHPTVQKGSGAICFDLKGSLLKSTDTSQLAIPIEFLRPCLRDSRSHDSIFEDTNRYWLLLIPPDIPVAEQDSIFENYIRPLTGLIKNKMQRKARNGGKETSKGRQDWFLHPWEYFSNNKGEVATKPRNLTGRVWTFNRYGLWRRQSVATCCQNPVTANHGCYTYYLKRPIPEDLAQKFWDLLVAWFNSTLYLITMFEHAKIPAKHVQQVNLLEHRQMLVPKLGQVLENPNLCMEITTAIHDLDRWLKAHREETLPTQLRACLENPGHPRIQLDCAWSKAITGQKKGNEQQLRSIHVRVEKLLNLY